ncbi:hypothetical protein M422DRAFT_42299 [Sphaerobolus stellatus SS14]|nr:hypothetical protein M422DRAFT_42299 [Sphaerobolus stellatus SS14]
MYSFENFHYRYYCDTCNGLIVGSRVLCLSCESERSEGTVDFHGNNDYWLQEMNRDDLSKPYVPTHDMAKVRRPLHDCNRGALQCAALAALKRARKIMTRSKRLHRDMEDGEGKLAVGEREQDSDSEHGDDGGSDGGEIENDDNLKTEGGSIKGDAYQTGYKENNPKPHICIVCKR